jgi:transposase
MDISELLRMLRAGESDRAITERLFHNRRTVAKYRAWAQAHGLLAGPLPKPGALHALLEQTLPAPVPPQQTSTLARYAQEVADLRARGMEMAAIRVRLEERHQHPVSYGAVWRLVRTLSPKQPETFVRVEVPPGSEAQVDFGYAGRMVDPASGQERRAWVFVLVLSWSRHLYAEVVFDQRVETWLLCHQHAFAWFGGVPARIVPDNLKAAIVRASFTEPVAQRSYRECAEHAGFLIDPNPPRSPNLKGKVEQGGVHYVCRNFLAGRTPEPVDELNAKLRRWAEQTAGTRVHGTTKQRPLERFATVERAALLPLPVIPYDLAVWKRASVSRDCYLSFEQAYYSAPFRLVGQQLWVRGGARTVELYADDHRLIATHTRARASGERHTILAHLPPEKVPGLVLTRENCQLRAAAIGPKTAEVIADLLAHRPEDRLRTAGRVLQLGVVTSAERLERTCARALHFGDHDFLTLKRILQEGLDQEPLPAAVVPARSTDSAGPTTTTRPPSSAPPPSPLPADAVPWGGAPSYRYARPAQEFAAHVLGALR